MAAASHNVAVRDVTNASSLSSIASDILLEELRRRQEKIPKPECGSKKETAYNTPLHVFALVLILAISTIACAFPILARRFPKLPIPRNFLFYSKHFGTGVLIATAFVHLLPTAFVSLTDPCLPAFWNVGYPAMAGLIAMTAVFAVVSIEMFFAMKGAGHSHGHDWHTLGDEEESGAPLNGGHTHGGAFGMQHSNESSSRLVQKRQKEERQHMNGSAGLYHDSDGEDAVSESDLELDDLDPVSTPMTPAAPPTQPLNPSGNSRPHHHRHLSVSSEITPATAQKQLLQCLLLEAGILFHSIFIGMSLSVTTGSSFVVLLIAIGFHQTFEGFALGSRIGALIPALFSPSSPKPWLMALAYGTTTPIGQAIGLGLHELYDPASATGLLMVGITNAVSSGLLLFAGLVELLAEDFLSDRSYEILRGRKRIEACLAVAAGGALMALVGAWA